MSSSAVGVVYSRVRSVRTAPSGPLNRRAFLPKLAGEIDRFDDRHERTRPNPDHQ